MSTHGNGRPLLPAEVVRVVTDHTRAMGTVPQKRTWWNWVVGLGLIGTGLTHMYGLW